MDLDNLGFLANVDQVLPIMALYIGPETILPFMSALAAVAGFLLMFWQRFVGLFRKLWRIITRKEADVAFDVRGSKSVDPEL
jgi:hypothetical protein